MKAMTRRRFEIEALDEVDPFEIDDQLVHLYKHEGMDVGDIYEVWADNPLFYPGKAAGPADWLMVGEVTGIILLVPLMAGSGVNKAKPIGVYEVQGSLDRRYRKDSR